MGKFSKKNRMPVLIVIFVLIMAAAVYFAAWPLVRSIAGKSDEIQTRLIDQEIEDLRLNSLPNLEEDLAYVEANKKALDVILSQESELGFIENVESIAEKTGNIITLSIGDYSDPKEIAKIKKINKKNTQEGILDEVAYTVFFPIQINVKGNYENLVKFIHMFENSQFYANIISVDTKKELIDQNSQKNIFTPTEEADKSKKEILNTNINAIVYTKK